VSRVHVSSCLLVHVRGNQKCAARASREDQVQYDGVATTVEGVRGQLSGWLQRRVNTACPSTHNQWLLSQATAELNKALFEDILSKFAPSMAQDTLLLSRLYHVLDENNDGFINFRELIIGGSRLCVVRALGVLIGWAW